MTKLKQFSNKFDVLIQEEIIMDWGVQILLYTGGLRAKPQNISRGNIAQQRKL